MDKRLTAAGYAIKPILISSSLPSYLIVTLNGAELPGSRRPLPDAIAGSTAYLRAEASAFSACEAFAIEHALLDGAELVVCELCQGNGDGCRACAGAGAFLADLPTPAPAPAGWASFPAELTAPGAGEPGHYGTANDSEIDAEDFAEQVQLAVEMGRELDREEDAPADPKDAAIAALAAEVKRLAGYLGTVGETDEPLYSWEKTTCREACISARALLRRLGLALAAGLLASGLWAAPASPQAPARAPRHVTRPLSSISVKVMPHAAYQGRFRASRAAWAITTADADSCTAWVDGGVPGIEAAELAAFKGCRAAVDRAVDAAHAAAEKGGAK